MCIPVSGLNSASATTAQQLRLSNYGSATTAQQPRLSNHGSATKLGSRFSNYASATTAQQPKSTLASATKPQQPKPTPSGKYMHCLIFHVISKSHPLWQVHALSHLPRHIKIPPPLASTCTVSSYTSYQNPTPSGKYMRCLILHIISKSHPLWQLHAQSHLPRHIKIPPPLASTCAVSSYTSYQNPTPSGKYMHSLILHVISKSHPLWQVHAQTHLTHHIKIPPPLASTCTVSSYTSYQNPTPSGNYMHGLIFHVISKSHPLWQVHAQSHLTRNLKIPPPLASTCTVSSYTSYQNPTPSGTYMHSLIFHVISKSHPFWQVHAQSHLTRNLKIPPPLASTCAVSFYTSYQNPTPCGKYMHSLTLHVISKSHPLWQLQAQSHLTRHIKIPPPLASTCIFSSSTSYQNPTPSGKYMHSLILHIIEGSLEVKLPTIWTDEKQSRAEAERRERLEERRSEEKESEERRCRCAKRSESRETLCLLVVLWLRSPEG